MDKIKLPASLEAIATKRKGGVFNIRGINYQALYTVHRLLEEFSTEMGASKYFQLEGIEDLDFYTLTEKSLNGQFIQLKRKSENLGSDDFIKDILENLLEVYDLDTNSSFLIVSNVHTTGKLQDLVVSNKGGKPLSVKTENYWSEKVLHLRSTYKSKTISHFLSKIHFIRKSEDELYKGSLDFLINRYKIINGNEFRFFQALYHSVIIWSLEKKIISKHDIDQTIQAIFDDMSRGVINRAIRGGWIELIDFNKIGDAISNNGYFEGKAATPYHIAANLPIERPNWENEILESVKNFDVTLIKASSGQGKSTLAWRVSMILSKQGFSIYQLTEIGNDAVQDVYLYIESRLKLGIVPIIVIDGLNEDLKDWHKLAKKAQILRGVKFIITSREEDWFRYGNGASQLNLKPIAISLNEKEAHAIYNAFQKQKKIHENVKHWQIAWEKVNESKLLIEYVYLLTQGQMIHERMIDQLNAFQNDKNEAAKKNILRLTSVADILHIKLPTVGLLDFINAKMGFQGDQATALQSLKDEYHLLIQDREYIEGLHPIRSKHISNILHEALPLSITLIELLSVIEPQNLFNFISHVPLLLHTETSRNAFIEKLAIVVSEKSYQDIVNVILGLFSTDAHIHWVENRKVFDQLSAQGIMIYSMLRTPFRNLSVEDFNFINEYNPSFTKNLDNISESDMAHSNTVLFLKSLKKILNDKPLKENWKKVTHLERWFQRFDLDSKILKEFSVEDLECFCDTMSAEDLGEIIYSVYLTKSTIYDIFYKKNQIRLINKLKIETDSLTIEPQGNSLEIRYIVNTQANINEQSVSRIKTIGYCMPHFETFNTAGIYFPNPYLKSLSYKHDESVKHGNWKNWLNFDDFSTKSNRVWVGRIESYYEFETQYEWQKYWVDYRNKIVDWLRQSSRLLEVRMSKMTQFDNESKKWLSLRQALAQYKKLELLIRYDDNFKKDDHKRDIENFNEWKSPIENVFNQTFPEPQNLDAWRVYKLNIKDALSHLPMMQESFDSICLKTAQYFETNDLKDQELKAYSYFSDLITFFYDEFHLKKRNVFNPRTEVKIWKEEKQKGVMQKLQQVKEDFENINFYELLIPVSILSEGYLDSVVFGIRNITPQEFQNDLQYLFQGLMGLSNVKAQFFYLVLIDNDDEANKHCFRFSDNFLEEAKLILTGKKLTFDNQLFPIELSEKIVNQLEGIKISEKSNEDPIKTAIFFLHEAFWRYSEINQRVSKNDSGLSSWRKKMLDDIEKTISINLHQIKVNALMYNKYEAIANLVVTGNLDFDEEFCQKYWEEDILEN